MREYIAEALSYRFIRPSTSLAGASFFFVKKRDGGLDPVLIIGGSIASR